MRKKISLLILGMLFSTTAINAQTKIWDLGGGAAPWTIANSPYTTNQVIDNLGLQIQGGTGTANFGATNASVKTFATSPEYTSVNRFQLNGGGSAPAGTFLPAQRYLYFAAAGSVTVEVLFIGGGSGNRTMFVTDGTTVLGQLTATNSTDSQILTTTAKVVNGNVYIYGDQACNLYRVKVTGPLGTTVVPTLAVSNSQMKSDVNVVAAKNQVNILNVKSSTDVKVYTMTGSLVKSFNTTTDKQFDLKTGMYIVSTKNEKGEQSVKVSVK